MAHRSMGFRLGLLLLTITATSLQSVSAACQAAKATEESTIPDFFDFFKRDFTLMLEMTELYNNVTNYVKHSYFAGSDEGEAVEASVVAMYDSGAFIAYHYFPGPNRYIEQFDDSCIEPEEHHPVYVPYGWFDDNTEHGVKMYGPATILRSTHFQEAEFHGSEFTIDGIKCEKWYICVDGRVEINLYFSAKDLFDMPQKGLFDDPQIANRLPVMFEVLPEMRSEHIRYTVVNFFPALGRHSSIETPRGLDCEDKVSIEPDKKVPKIPSHFTMSSEVILNPFIDGMLFDRGQQLEKYQLTYSEDLGMVRLDTAIPEEQAGDDKVADKIIHDFNTGVQYAINRQYGKCERDFIPPYSFDKTHPGYIGSFGVMAGPNELFHIDDKYAYVGQRDARSQRGDLYTSTRSDIPDPDSEFLVNIPKAVLEYYFVKGEESSPDFLGIPSRGDLFVYNKTDPLLIEDMTTTNIFDAKLNLMVSPSEFSVTECFDKWSDDWSTLYIFFPADEEQFATEAANDNEFKNDVFGSLLEIGDVSPTRIGSIDVSDGVSGWYSNTSDSDVIIVEVKLLERAPYLYGYRMPDDPFEIPGDEETGFDVLNIEGCAELCTMEELFECKSFHYCKEQGSCYLSKSTGAQGPQTKNYTCMHYIDNHENHTFDDLPTAEVDNRLRSYISEKKFQFSIRFEEKDVNFTATQHIMFKTPDPTDPIRKQFYLFERHRTIKDPDAILEPNDNSLLSCMQLCISWKDFRCETLAHNEIARECLLYSEHAREINETRFETKIDSYVHSRNYVNDYNYMLGGISINTTGPIVKGFSPEECAMECSTKKDYNCNSFEFCWDDATCHLHVETFMDVSDGGNYSTKQQCMHFEKKAERIFTRYPKQGMPNGNHKLVAQLTGVTECAKLCLEETGSDASQTCQSYDYCVLCEEGDFQVCGQDNRGGINMCFLGNHHLGEPGLTLQTTENCEHYSRDLFGDQDYASWITSHRMKAKPYTGGSMAGLAFGMIFLGIILTLGFLFALVKFHPEKVPKGLALPEVGSNRGTRPSIAPESSVNFEKLSGEPGESDI
ncbi:uncharacterized protein [Macrobrachium rosenbergii]|uniref:uncharacterized protein n=1 Tax=Macrobrachium rosenbergii TaxID=79674 RepID=UPI0034D4CDA5